MDEESASFGDDHPAETGGPERVPRTFTPLSFSHGNSCPGNASKL